MSTGTRQPELTWQEAEIVVDAFLHCVLEAFDDTLGLRAQLTLHLQGQSPAIINRCLEALERRRNRYRTKADRIDWAR